MIDDLERLEMPVASRERAGIQVVRGLSARADGDLEDVTISKLFPANVSVCIASADMYHHDVFPQEAAMMATSSSKRRGEFIAGRNAARAALARLGAPMLPILRSSQRAPLWPNGFVGSITHCDEFCCAVVSRTSQLISLGFDAETIDSLEDAVATLVCIPGEFVHFSKLPKPLGTNWAKSAFCAKEAFHKCYNPLTGVVLEFQDVSVSFSLDPSCRAGTFEPTIITGDRMVLAPELLGIRGAWLTNEKRVYAASWQAQTDQSADEWKLSHEIVARGAGYAHNNSATVKT
jgi:4'-phosphopantetheinyl transferase EntD